MENNLEVMKAALDQKDLVIGNIETRCKTLEVKVKELEKENGEIEERIQIYQNTHIHMFVTFVKEDVMTKTTY